MKKSCVKNKVSLRISASKKKTSKKRNITFNFALSAALLVTSVILVVFPNFLPDVILSKVISMASYYIGVALFGFSSTKINDDKKGLSEVLTGIALFGLALFLINISAVLYMRLFALLTAFFAILSLFYGIFKFTRYRFGENKRASFTDDLNTKLAIIASVLQIIAILFSK